MSPRVKTVLLVVIGFAFGIGVSASFQKGHTKETEDRSIIVHKGHVHRYGGTYYDVRPISLSVAGESRPLGKPLSDDRRTFVVVTYLTVNGKPVVIQGELAKPALGEEGLAVGD